MLNISDPKFAYNGPINSSKWFSDDGRSFEIITPEWTYVDDDKHNFERIVSIKEQRRMGVVRGKNSTPQAPVLQVRASGIPKMAALRTLIWCFGPAISDARLKAKQQRINPDPYGQILTQLRPDRQIRFENNITEFGPIGEDGFRYAQLCGFINRGARIKCRNFHVALRLDIVHCERNLEKKLIEREPVSDFASLRSARISISEKAMCPREYAKLKKENLTHLKENQKGTRFKAKNYSDNEISKKGFESLSKDSANSDITDTCSSQIPVGSYMGEQGVRKKHRKSGAKDARIGSEPSGHPNVMSKPLLSMQNPNMPSHSTRNILAPAMVNYIQCQDQNQLHLYGMNGYGPEAQLPSTSSITLGNPTGWELPRISITPNQGLQGKFDCQMRMSRMSLPGLDEDAFFSTQSFVGVGGAFPIDLCDVPNSDNAQNASLMNQNTRGVCPPKYFHHVTNDNNTDGSFVKTCNGNAGPSLLGTQGGRRISLEKNVLGMPGTSLMTLDINGLFHSVGGSVSPATMHEFQTGTRVFSFNRGKEWDDLFAIHAAYLSSFGDQGTLGALHKAVDIIENKYKYSPDVSSSLTTSNSPGNNAVPIGEQHLPVPGLRYRNHSPQFTFSQ